MLGFTVSNPHFDLGLVPVLVGCPLVRCPWTILLASCATCTGVVQFGDIVFLGLCIVALPFAGLRSIKTRWDVVGRGLSSVDRPSVSFLLL